jgi:EAL domain-containing protein (putative c-di-GMP-specific phosphodiesterase class I)/CheY-like chemotaxis protein
MSQQPSTDARILIVDDEPANVVLLERILQKAGMTQITGTTDPGQAVRLFRELAPDLVLLDLHMPGLDGFEVLASLQDEIPGDSFVPVLVLTADVTSHARERALSAGAKDFLTKPFDRIEVLLRIQNLLETRALHVRLQRQNRALEAQVAEQAEREARAAQEHRLCRNRIERILAGPDLAMAFQPIVDVRTGAVIGLEALARFATEPMRAPDVWFAEAADVGLGTELEVAAIRAGLGELDRLPSGTYLSVNASPQTVLSAALGDVLSKAPGERVVVEITEHAQVEDYDTLHRALGGLRARGIRLAVDDAGAGYSSLQHILRLAPDIIKLDLTLTRGIDADPIKRALASSLVVFAAEIGAVITAEGVETGDELQALRDLGITGAQGYYLGRPGPLPVIVSPTLRVRSP